MSEAICTCHCGGAMFYRHLHAESCALSREGEEAPKSELQALRDERDRLREALQAFCDEVEMDAAAMAYKCDLGAGEWEAFIDRTKLYKQYLAAKAALTPAGEGGNEK